MKLLPAVCVVESKEKKTITTIIPLKKQNWLYTLTALLGKNFYRIARNLFRWIFVSILGVLSV